MGAASVAVKMLGPVVPPRGEQRLSQMGDVPPRSRLYGLVPLGVGTLWSESLTSYINRLAWKYRVSPRVLVAQEMAPHFPYRSSKGDSPKSFNGNAPRALERAATLELLTKRTDLHLLTAQAWVGDLSMRRALRDRPAWCPACYATWKEEAAPLYEPMLWMLKLVLICPRHKGWLEDRCPSCLHSQPFLKAATSLGRCMHCSTALGMAAPLAAEQERDAATLDWQEWVLLALDELRNASASGRLAWKQFFPQLATGCEGWGEKTRLAKIAGVTPLEFRSWLYQSAPSSLEHLLEFCYVCGVTPLQVLMDDLTPLKDTLHRGAPARPRRPRFLPDASF